MRELDNKGLPNWVLSPILLATTASCLRASRSGAALFEKFACSTCPASAGSYSNAQLRVETMARRFVQPTHIRTSSPQYNATDFSRCLSDWKAWGHLQARLVARPESHLCLRTMPATDAENQPPPQGTG